MAYGLTVVQGFFGHQAATSLPIFVLGLFAGALADRLDKRRLLILVNLLLFAIISTLCVPTRPCPP